MMNPYSQRISIELSEELQKNAKEYSKSIPET